jgi:hypothetical protein
VRDFGVPTISAMCRVTHISFLNIFHHKQIIHALQT